MQATPRISAALIVKNEAALLARCLESIRDSVDEIIIVDTGSQDGTQAIARRYTNRVFDFAWQNDFAAARQYAFDQASGDWVFWIDADDVLLHADQIRTSVQNAGAGVHCLWWKYVYSSDSYGNPTCEFWRERCVRHDQSFRWVGRVHEYLSNPQPHQSLHDPAVVVLHQRPAERNAGNLRRNLALLLEEYTQAPEQATTRQLLYLGNEYASLGDAKQAIGYFERYLRASTWADEKYLVQVQIAALQRQSERYEQAIDSDLQALKICPHWPDAYYGLARSYYALRDWHRVIHWSEVGRAMPQPQTSQIINPMEYRYAWIIYYTNALYQIGEIGEAQQWTRYALGICPADPQHQHNLRFFEQALAPQQPWIEMYSMPRGAQNTITV
jgi:tetratricopeptide (TPR) repeat protein